MAEAAVGLPKDPPNQVGADKLIASRARVRAIILHRPSHFIGTGSFQSEHANLRNEVHDTFRRINPTFNLMVH